MKRGLEDLDDLEASRGDGGYSDFAQVSMTYATLWAPRLAL